MTQGISALAAAFLFSALAQADPSILQKRRVEEGWHEAAARFSDLLNTSMRSAYNAAGPLGQLDFQGVPDWGDLAELRRAFNEIRDGRFLWLPETPDFSRRIPWLYPDDGCYARANLAAERAEGMGRKRPYKLFVFGDLAIQTQNAPEGWVYWWFHVVPIVLSKSQPYVIDPTTDPRGPLPLSEWIERITSDAANVGAVVCVPGAYMPDSLCDEEAWSLEGTAEEDQMAFLRLEWDRLVELGRNPVAELGVSPPW